MLACDRAARVDARGHDQPRQLLRALGLARYRGVVADERVQVPVTGVEDVRHPQAVLARELVDPPQHLRQARARDHAVLHVVVGRDPAHRGERRLAGLPDQLPLGVGARDAHAVRAVSLAHRDHLVEARLALRARAVQLHDQRGAGVGRVAGAHRALRSLDREAVHHLHSGGDKPRGHDVGDDLARLGGAVEEGDERPHRLRPGDHAKRDARRHAERPLGADERTHQVVSRPVDLLAAELHG